LSLFRAFFGVTGTSAPSTAGSSFDITIGASPVMEANIGAELGEIDPGGPLGGGELLEPALAANRACVFATLAASLAARAASLATSLIKCYENVYQINTISKFYLAASFAAASSFSFLAAVSAAALICCTSEISNTLILLVF
jgi:hypothetical protein